jgi:DNA-directed RNA polymerase specialized sigma24 family protein
MAEPVVDLSSDSDLVAQASSGDAGAFDALYRRHSGSAWRVAQAVTRDAAAASAAVAEAFGRVFDATTRGALAADEPLRLRLLAATRHAVLDAARADKLARAGGGSPARREPAPERDVLARAFVGLPERWRSLLWLNHVESLRVDDAGHLVDLSPSGASQALSRARAGLRQRYLQCHLLDVSDRECQRAANHLGAYTSGAIAARDAANVEAHLATCAACRARLEEMDDAPARLRGIALPFPLAMADAARDRWRAAIGATPRSALALVLPGGERLPRWAERTLVGASAAGVALGILAATVFSGRDATRPARQLALPSGRIEQPLASGVNDGAGVPGLDPLDLGAGSVLGGFGAGGTGIGGAAPAAAATVSGTDRSRGSLPTTPPSGRAAVPAAPTVPGDDDADDDPTTPPADEGTVEVGVGTDVGGTPVTGGVSVGGGSTGVQVGPVVVGDPPPPTEEPLEVGIGGALGDLIGLP